MAELTLFISHSSVDAAIAKGLIDLVEKALTLPARQIRCSSVNGYRLPVGADTSEQLRREVFVSRAFIGLITPASLRSAYVLFELGARWGAKTHLAPVLAAGADVASLAGPLSGLNALRLDEREQALQLVQDIGEYLEIPLEPFASFSSLVDSVVALASQEETDTESDQANGSQPKLSFRDNMYWGQGADDGPYCSRCYDAERKLIRLIREGGYKPRCPNCKNYFGSQESSFSFG